MFKAQEQRHETKSKTRIDLCNLNQMKPIKDEVNQLSQIITHTQPL